MRAPTRSEAGQRRGADGSNVTGRAVSRGSNDAASGPGRTAASAGSEDHAREPRRAVPVYSRPGDGRPVTGTAVPRTTERPSGGGGYYPYYYPYRYYPYGFYGSGYYGYGFGLMYDPFWYDPYYSGYGYGGGYSGGYYGGGSSYSRSTRDAGSLRLKIKPRQAEVFVDGYYVGVVDNFDGAFQKLTLDGGGHRVELKADGFEPLQFDVLVTPGETVTYKGDMKRVQ